MFAPKLMDLGARNAALLARFIVRDPNATEVLHANGGIVANVALIFADDCTAIGFLNPDFAPVFVFLRVFARNPLGIASRHGARKLRDVACPIAC